MATRRVECADAWLSAMKTSTDYIGIAQMQADMTYSIWARNAYVGIWLPGEQGFLISRYKLSSAPFLFVEYHWDAGEPLGTAKPLHPLEKCPMQIPAKAEYRDEAQNVALCRWLDDLEIRHPPVPGWSSVDERRQASAASELRQAKQRVRRLRTSSPEKSS